MTNKPFQKSNNGLRYTYFKQGYYATKKLF